AAIAAVAAVRPAVGHVFLAPKTQTAVAAVAGLDAQIGFIDEFHRVLYSLSALREIAAPRPSHYPRHKKAPRTARLFTVRLRRARIATRPPRSRRTCDCAGP